jgi:hypothetical protein
MQSKRLILLLTLLLALVVTSACGPRAITPATAAPAADQLVVQLPAIYLDVAADGQMSLAEGPLSQALAALGVDLSDLAMGEETVQSLSDAGVQHLQLETQPDGLYIFMNGRPFPTLVWDGDSLDSLAEMLPNLGVDLGDAAGLLPLLPDLGVGLVLRLPGGTGAGAPALAQRVTPPAAQGDLASALSAPTTIDLTLTYGPDGVGQLQGLNPFMLGMIPPDALQQSPETLESVAEMGINSLSITFRPTGLVVLINGEPFVYLRSTDEAQLLEMIDFLLRYATDPQQAAQLGGIVRQVLPALWRQGLRLTVNFPA